jgi:hypothetical protein
MGSALIANAIYCVFSYQYVAHVRMYTVIKYAQPWEY